MSQLKTGACGHVIAVWDPHTACAGFRPCEMSDKPCELCDSMSPALKERAIWARARRLKRAASKHRFRVECTRVEGAFVTSIGNYVNSLRLRAGGWSVCLSAL